MDDMQPEYDIAGGERGKFTEDYYKSGSYAHYLARDDRYRNMADEIVRCLKGVCLIDPARLIVDYGCGPGLFVRGLERAGCTNVVGLDISDWALAECARRGVTACHPETFVWNSIAVLFCLDVLEHMDRASVEAMLSTLRAEYLVVRIPVCRENGGRYILDVSEQDATHVIRWTKESWYTLLSQCGYTRLFRFGLYTIYDTPGVLAAMLKRH